VLGARSYVSVDCEKGKREGGEQQRWEADGAALACSCCVPQGWLECSPTAFPPSHPTWLVTGLQVGLRGTWRPCEDEGLQHHAANV